MNNLRRCLQIIHEHGIQPDRCRWQDGDVDAWLVVVWLITLHEIEQGRVAYTVRERERGGRNGRMIAVLADCNDPAQSETK